MVSAARHVTFTSVGPWIDAHASWPVVLVGTFLAMWLAAEVGYRMGRGRDAVDEAAGSSGVVGVVLGAMLALLGLMLAFSFSIVESRFAARRALVLEEANAIGTAYLRAAMLTEPHADRVQGLLRQYVDVRLHERTPAAVRAAEKRSGELHRALWTEATAVAGENRESTITALFIESLNQVIDLHQARVTVGLYARLPWPILVTLYFVSLLALGSLGYSSGTPRARSAVPILAVALATTSLMVIIVELDRPYATLFQVSQRAIVDVRDAMDATPPPR